MKKFKLVACAAAAAAMFATNAFAAADMDSTTELTNAGVYVGETTLNVAPATTTLTRGAAADQVATVTLGASLAADAVAYVRFQLPVGVTFVGQPTYAVNDDGAGNLTDVDNDPATPNVATPQPAIVSIAQGGAGENFVIFAVAPRSTGSSLVGSNVGTFTTGTGIAVTNKNAVSLSYKLFETLTNAANNQLPLKERTESSFVSFANAIAVVPGASQSAIADVAAGTGAYTAFTGGSLVEEVAAVGVTYTPRAMVGTGVNSAGIGDIVADTNDITITGDFTAAGAVTLGTTCAAAPVATATVAADGLSATFTGIIAAQIGQNLVVCYGVNGTDQIIASNYTGAVDLDAESGFAVGDGNTGTGQITRNGTTLRAAFSDASSGGYNTMINIVNTSAAPATFTTSCLRQGQSAFTGTGYTVPAGQTMRYVVNSIAGLNCPTGVRGLELTFSVPQGSVIGSVIRKSNTTGEASFEGMVGNSISALATP